LGCRRTALIIAGAVTIWCAVPGPAHSAPPAAAFGQFPAIDHPAISPLGHTLAWHQATDTGSYIVTYDIERRRPRPAAQMDPALLVRRLVWASDRALLYDVAPPWRDGSSSWHVAPEETHTFTVDLRQRSPHTMLPRSDVHGLFRTRLLSAYTDDPHEVIMSSRVFAPVTIAATDASHSTDIVGISTLFRVNTHSGHGRVMERGTPATLEWIVDGSGHALARSEWVADAGTFAILASDGGTWRSIYSRADGRRMRLGGLMQGDRSVLAIGPGKGSRIGAWSVALDGSSVDPVFEDPDSDVADVVADPLSGRPVGLRLNGLVSRTHWLDADWQARSDALVRRFGGRQVDIESRSSDGQRYVVAVSDASHPPVYQLVDYGRATADVIGASYPGLQDAELGNVRPWVYPARDGMKIPAYLTLPPGREEQGLPLVVLLHDGPARRDEFAFDWWAQFLATRGYAVLQPQYRGSTGFGEAFEHAGRGEWGGRMQDDVTDGVTALVAQGVADGDCVCVMGAGYGAYAALLGAALTPALYSCAVGVNGIYDLPKHLGDLRTAYGADAEELAWWGEQWGAVSSRMSPVNAAPDVRASVLLAHVADDPVFSASQSLGMERALASAGRSATLVKLGGEDHWLTLAATRTRVLTEIETFLNEQTESGCRKGQ
jgi:dipeptidyl aminopeptidase/acylaminoacyl peptidase